MKRQILIVLCSTLFWNCSRNLHVEREPNVPIEYYKSYAWNKLEASNASHPFYNSAELNRLIIKEIDENLNKKGVWRNSINPDFLVDFHVYIEEQKYQNFVCGTGFYRGDRFLPDLTQHTYCEAPEIVKYDDGTLIIDIVDAHTKQLVWRASMSDIIDNPTSASKIFSRKVNRILKNLPLQKKNRKPMPQTDFEKAISVK